MNEAMARWEELLSLALAKKGDEGVVLNDLLAAFHRGFPIERLRVLLDHDDPDVVREGAWILSELGARGRPFVSYLPALLRHPRRWVRIYAVDSVLTCASSDDGELITTTLKLLDDVDDGVRWAAVDFLMKAPEPLLRAAANFLGQEESSEMLRALTILLDGSPADVQELLRSRVGALGRVGLAAAGRRQDIVAIEEAKTVDDDEARTFAERVLEDIRRKEQREASKRTSPKNPGPG